MKCKRLLSVPVLSVLFLVGFIYYTTVFVFIEDWLGLKSPVGILNALIFSSLAFMWLVSFAACVLIDPGHVPPTFVPDVEDGEASDQALKKNGVRSRYCDKCCIYKPPRAHHCRVCRSCILKMDHHCLWVNNCVGYSNYKAFVNLVIYAAMGCIYSMVIILNAALKKDWKYGESFPLKIFYITCGCIIVTLSLVLGTLLGWHIYLLSNNMTTIEYHEGIRAIWLARKSGQSYHHPYNFGLYRNINLILGPKMLKWFCPMEISHLKDGISFRTVRDNL
ncbi:PREDICTED: probable protein S-acyltransferase 15 [Nelumbo nucifera]|uniref:S-acyltransferase n=1 Tax=Nelumbo nucifera TaxID=4432 RepID=A0A1U7Z4X1_NELNU|nr:PREDICTED: probable protein S-acyltransferase 15 [Nelumbo nucifera]